MKKSVLTVGVSLLVIAFAGCSKDSSSKKADPNEYIKYITKISGHELSDTNYQSIVHFTYDERNRMVNMISSQLKDGVEDDFETNSFSYEQSGKLDKVSSGNTETLVSTILPNKDEAYKIGKVLAYDSYLNPSKLMFFYDEFLGKGNTVVKQGTVDIKYDDKPFFAFHTFRAAGIIQALDGIKLNFASPTQAPQLKLAKEIMPNTNPIEITYKNEEGVVLSHINITINYDTENYPVSSEVRNTKKTRSFNFQSNTYSDWREEVVQLKINYLYRD